MHPSIEAIKKLNEMVNEICKKAQEQLDHQVSIRDDVVDSLRQNFRKSRQQLSAQLDLEIDNFQSLENHYQVAEKELKPDKMREYEKQKMTEVKNMNIDEYKTVLSQHYDMNDKKDRQYYQLTVQRFVDKIMNVKTATQCHHQLNLLKQAQEMFLKINEDQWIQDNPEISKAQQVLKSQSEAIGEQLKEAIQIEEQSQGLTLGTLMIQNQYLFDWYYLDQLQEVLKGYYELQKLCVPFYDELNQYYIKDSDIHLSFLRLLEFYTLINSTKEAVHIYYDYQNSLFESVGYQNCDYVEMDESFVGNLQKELENDTHRIAILTTPPEHIPVEFYKKAHCVFITKQDLQVPDNFITIQQYSINELLINNQYILRSHLFQQEDLEKIRQSQPIKIEKNHTFVDEYKEHMNDELYYMSHQYQLPFEENFVIVSKDVHKRVLYLAQLLIQRLPIAEVKYVYYDHQDTHPLRKMIDECPLEEIYPDIIDDLMDDLINGQCFVALADAPEEILGYLMTLLDIGHIIMTSDHIIDGYKNLLLDDNMIDNMGEREYVEFEYLSLEEMNKLLESYFDKEGA